MIRLALITLAVWLLMVTHGAAQEQMPIPAQITIVTDGSTHEVEVLGGDVGYPGPNEVVIEQDEHGMVVVSRVRLFAVFDEQVYLPMVSR
jgi:hypothetical protein